MSLTERYGNRNGDLLYSGWHRPASMRRFGVPQEIADEMSMVNIDTLMRRERWVETRRDTHEPLALIETAMDLGQPRPDKASRATERLAKRAHIEAYVVLITQDGGDDIASFRVRQINPLVGCYVRVTPQQMVDLLLRVRRRALDRMRPAIDRVLWPEEDI